MRLSIIIPSHNYAAYVGAAIDSALALNWSDKEIIVADDGSTDSSHKVIAAYGSKIIPLFLPNGGQNSACNVAFARSRGDIIIFLDSDDILFPCVADTLRSAWSDRVSKLQWSLAITDENLRPLGRCYPTYQIEPTPKWIKRSIARTGHYPFSPTSGGAWARRFLCQVFPVPVRDRDQGRRSVGDYQAPPIDHSLTPIAPFLGCQGDLRVPNLDHYLSKLAPFFGDVLCIDHNSPQGAYRIHGNNHFAGSNSETIDCTYAYRCIEKFECARHVNSVLARLNIGHDPIKVEHDERAMKGQLVCQRFRLQPRQYANLPEALWKYWHSVWLNDASIVRKVKWIVWSLFVAAGSQRVSSWAVRQLRQGP